MMLAWKKGQPTRPSVRARRSVQSSPVDNQKPHEAKELEQPNPTQHHGKRICGWGEAHRNPSTKQPPHKLLKLPHAEKFEGSPSTARGLLPSKDPNLGDA